MKFVYSLSSPLVNGSEWVYNRFTRFVSRPALRVGANVRRGVSRLPPEIHGSGGKRTVPGSALSRTQLAGRRQQMPRFHAENRDRIEVSGLQQREEPPLVSDPSAVSARISAVMIDDLFQELTLNPPKDLSPARRRQRDKAMALIRDEALIDAANSFNIIPLEGEVEGDGLRVGGEILSIPEELPKKGVVTAFGCGACTLGPRLEARVRALFGEKRAAIALALDALGNELLQLLGRRMRSDLLAAVRRQGLILGQRLRVGDSAFDLPSRAAVLRLAGAVEIGIGLHRDDLLRPQKAIVAVFAVGHKLPKLSLSRYRD